MSTLITEGSQVSCSGDKLKYWKNEVEKFIKLNPYDQAAYLDGLSDEARFLEILKNKDNLVCEFNNNLVPVGPVTSVRVPDPLAVAKLERTLGRGLTELELEEGYEFVLDTRLVFNGVGVDMKVTEKDIIYTLPFVNFPEDL